MSQNTVKARIQLKSDTESNWNKALHFIPLRGEIIIYLADESHPFSRLKVGDGTMPVIDLPFVADGNSTIAEYHTTEEWNQQRDYIPKELHMHKKIKSLAFNKQETLFFILNYSNLQLLAHVILDHALPHHNLESYYLAFYISYIEPKYMVLHT